MPNEHKTILNGIPLADLIDQILGHLDAVPIVDSIAQLLAITNHPLIHIQFKSLEDDKPLPKALLWNRKSWMGHYERQMRLKRDSAEQRMIANLFSENVDRIATKLAAKCGLPKDGMKDAASKMLFEARKSNNYSFLEAIGIYIEKYNKTV